MSLCHSHNGICIAIPLCHCTEIKAIIDESVNKKEDVSYKLQCINLTSLQIAMYEPALGWGQIVHHSLMQQMFNFSLVKQVQRGCARKQ